MTQVLATIGGMEITDQEKAEEQYQELKRRISGRALIQDKTIFEFLWDMGNDIIEVLGRDTPANDNPCIQRVCREVDGVSERRLTLAHQIRLSYLRDTLADVRYLKFSHLENLLPYPNDVRDHYIALIERDGLTVRQLDARLEEDDPERKRKKREIPDSGEPGITRDTPWWRQTVKVGTHDVPVQIRPVLCCEIIRSIPQSCNGDQLVRQRAIDNLDRLITIAQKTRDEVRAH